MTPRLKRRGVVIETEIEYRVGPYFVLAVNIQSIDWRKLVRATYRDAAQRQALNVANNERSSSESSASAPPPTRGSPAKVPGRERLSWRHVQSLWNLSLFDMIERTMVVLHNVHYLIYLPLCWVAYYCLCGSAIRQFILSSVADEIFYYVEEKGMEMDIKVCRAETQAALMLSALREIRADGQDQKQKQQQSAEAAQGKNLLGPLMGSAVAADQGPAPPPPDNFTMPENLEFIGLEIDLPVGFQRMRWAFLSKRSEFVTEALYKVEAKYENSVMGEWSKFADYIGEPKLPDDINSLDFVGAEKEGEYLMPKSAFVSANMCYETHYLLAYNDYCFCLKKRGKNRFHVLGPVHFVASTLCSDLWFMLSLSIARNPDAPFGKTFIAWTQYLVVNTGNNSCRLTCSVQPEFPNGEPMVSRQIRSGMRAGTGELFVLLGETVAKYADEYA
jgi:VAD1 Analog of StAR-related lipid transfer domain